MQSSFSQENVLKSFNSLKHIVNWRVFFFYTLCFFTPISIAGAEISIFGLYITTLILFFQKKEKWENSILTYGMVLFFIGVILSTFFSNNITKSFYSYQSFWRYLLPFIIPSILKNETKETYLKLLLFSAVLVSTYGIIQYFTGIALFNPAKQYTPTVWHATGVFDFHLTFAGVIQIIFPIFFVPIFSSIFAPMERILFAFSSLILSAAIFCSLARSVWLAFFIAIFTFFILRKPKVAFGFLAVLIISITFFFSQVSFKDINNLQFKSASIEERIVSVFQTSKNKDRLYMWQVGLETIEDYFWFGIGPDIYDVMEPYYLKISEETGHIFDHPPKSEVGVHNIYLQTWIHYGLLGFIGYLLIWLGLILSAVFALKRKLAPTTREYSYLIGVVSGLSGSMFVGFFENNFRDGEVQIMIFLSMGMAIHFIQRIRKIKKSRL